MYCVKCGVKLEDGVNQCPLCTTIMNFSDENVSECHYPNHYPEIRHSLAFAAISTLLVIIAIITILTICLTNYGKLAWGNYVISSLVYFYFVFIFPTWFNKFHYLLFIGFDFILTLIFLFIINILVDGHWWVSFALPLNGILAIIILTTITLIKHVKKGGFFIAGSLIIFASCSSMLVELFQVLTFGSKMWQWSLYCVISGSLFGMFLIIAGFIKPLGNYLRKIFYI